MMINELGCIKHQRIDYFGEVHGVSFWKCLDCLEVFPQHEDCGSGC